MSEAGVAAAAGVSGDEGDPEPLLHAGMVETGGGEGFGECITVGSFKGADVDGAFFASLTGSSCKRVRQLGISSLVYGVRI